MVVRRTSVCLAKYSTKGAGAACGNVLCTISHSGLAQRWRFSANENAGCANSVSPGFSGFGGLM